MDYSIVSQRLFKKCRLNKFKYPGIIFLLFFLCTITLHGQRAERLIIYQGADEILSSQSDKIVLDFTSLFNISDIEIVKAEEYQGENKTEDFSASLDALQILIESKPGSTPLIAFVFAPEQGPDVYDVMDLLDQCSVPVKILINGYFYTHYSLIIKRSPLLGRVTFMQYAIGQVTPDEKSKENDFPVVPVLIGAAATTTGIVLLTGGDDSEGCTQVDASWNLPDPLCSDDTPINLQATGTAGGVWTGTGVDASGNFNPAQGTQSITYTVGEQECERSSTQVITVLQRGNADWTAPSFVCEGNSVLLSSTGTLNGQWDGQYINDNGDGTATFSPTDMGAFPITYTAGEGVCMDMNTQTIEVLPKPDASWTPPGELCTNQSVVLTPSGTQGGSWTGDGVTDNGDGTATFSQSVDGAFAVTYTVGSDCPAQTTHDIVVIDQADASWTVPDPVCAEESVNLIPDGTLGGTWTGEGITDNGDGTASFVQNTAGSYTVTYTAGPTACEESETNQIVVTELPDPSWTAPEQLCTDEEILLVPEGTSDGTWTGNGITDNGDGTATFTQSIAGSFTITYSVGDICTESLSHDITVIEQGDASWTVPESICEGESVTLAPDGTTGGTWTGNGVTDNGDGTATFTQNTAGSYEITYTVGTTECQDSETNAVEVTETPDPSWTAPENVCANEEILLVPEGTPDGTWTGDGITDNGDGTATFTQSIAGTFDINYSVGDICIETQTHPITVIDQADASWTPPEGICSGASISLTTQGTQGGTWSGVDVSSDGIFTPGEAGEYIITYQVGEGTCADMQTSTIIVILQGDASWTPPENVCTGIQIQLTSDGTQGGTWSGQNVTADGLFSADMAGSFEITYTAGESPCQDMVTSTITVEEQGDPAWTLPDPPCAGETIILVPDEDTDGFWSGSGIIDLGDGTSQFSQSESGIFTITYTVGEGDCAVDLSQDIEVTPFPDATWTPQTDMLCPGEILNLSATTGTWSGNNVTDNGDGTGQFSTIDEGVHTITLTIGEGFCSDSEPHDVTVGDDEPPVITIPATDLIVECDGTGNTTEFDNWIDQNGNASADDFCGGIITWTASYNTPLPFCSETLVTFTVCDDHNNCATTVASFIIMDTALPIFDILPPDITVSCDNIPPPDEINAFDDCSGTATVFVVEDQTTGCPYEIIRTFTATDACGNTAVYQQAIFVTDDIAPVGEPLIEVEIFCDFPCEPEVCLPPPEPMPFTDNCDPDIEVLVEDNPIDIQPNFQIWERIYTGIDDCGNSTIITQMIFVNCIGTIPPGDNIPFFEVSNVAPFSIFEQELIIPDFNPDPEHPATTHSIKESQFIDFGQMRLIEISSIFKKNNQISFGAAGSYGMSSIFGTFDFKDTPNFIQARSALLNVYGSLRYTPKNRKSIQLEAGFLYSQQTIDRITVLQNDISNSVNSVSEQDDIQLALKGRYRFALSDFGNLEAEAIFLPFIESNNIQMRLKYVVPIGIRHSDRYVKIIK